MNTKCEECCDSGFWGLHEWNLINIYVGMNSASDFYDCLSRVFLNSSLSFDFIQTAQNSAVPCSYNRMQALKR